MADKAEKDKPETAEDKKAREAAEAAEAKAAEELAEKLAEGVVGTAITNAKNMLRAKKKIQADLQAARDFLNQSITMGVVNDEQAKWIQETLPKRTRESKED